jgi:thiamine biosynthesis protein ThiS
MLLYLNDQPCEVASGENLEHVFNALKIDVLKGMAVAVNNTVVAKLQWPQFKITEGDKIILIK